MGLIVANNLRRVKAKYTMGVRNFNLRSSQVRNRGKIVFEPVLNISRRLSPHRHSSPFYLPLFNTVNRIIHK